MPDAKQSPPWWRVVAAFVLAPGIAAFLFASLQPAYEGLPSLADRIWRTATTFAVFGAYPATIIFGIPAFLILRDRLKPSALNCAVAGALVASLPWFMLGIVFNPDEAYVNGHITVHNGWKTWWGWGEFLTFIGQIAAVGAFGGLLFWVIAALGADVRNRGSA